VRSLSATSGAGLATTTAGATDLSVSLPGLIRQLDVGLTLTLVEVALAAGDRTIKALVFPLHTVKDRRLARISLVTGRAGLGIRIGHLSFIQKDFTPSA
jgi:hypothetical protein